jgi:hypothetical protein
LKDAGWLGLPEVSRHFIGQWMAKGVYAVATHDDAKHQKVIALKIFACAGASAMSFLRYRDERFRFWNGMSATAFVAVVVQPRMPHPRGERAKSVQRMQYSYYPRINPCMIVLVTRGEELLLARAQRFNRPMFSTLAGFVEAGESVEETLVREVREEVGSK